MTKEDLEYLKTYETNFRTAIKSDYSRNVTATALYRMLEIYRLHTGLKYTLCVHCSGAVLKFLKVIGTIYFEEVQKGNEPSLKDNELENKVTKMEKKNAKSNNRRSKS